MDDQGQIGGGAVRVGWTDIRNWMPLGDGNLSFCLESTGYAAWSDDYLVETARYSRKFGAGE